MAVLGAPGTVMCMGGRLIILTCCPNAEKALKDHMVLYIPKIRIRKNRYVEISILKVKTIRY